MRMTSAVPALLLLVAIIGSTTGNAATRMNDFAYGFRLATPASGLVRLVLPETVYRHLARADAADIRIFKMDGQEVPHLLRRPARAANATERIDLPFFPLPGPADAAGRYPVRIQTDERGAVLNLSPLPAEAIEGPAPAYLIDISQLPRGLEKLTLTWQPHRPDVLLTARLESSSDLEKWRPLVDKITLADIRRADHRLQKRTIFLPPSLVPVKYLRLSWLGGGDAVTIAGVEGRLQPVAGTPERYWVKATHRAKLEAPGSMQFDSGGWLPVDRIDLHWARGDSLVVGTIQSRAAENAVWQVHHRGVFYHLNVKDAALQNDPVAIAETTDRYWRLAIDNRQSGLGGSVPRLMLGGRPHELFFVPEGGGAYIMAYGNRNATALEAPAGLVKTVALAAQSAAAIDIGQRVVLGGADRIKSPQTGRSAQKLTLSTWLLAIVLLVGFFTWWLVRRSLHRY